MVLPPPRVIQKDVEPLTKCQGCGKIVPKTNLCVYCGAPILYKKPHRA